eukprot:101596_1
MSNKFGSKDVHKDYTTVASNKELRNCNKCGKNVSRKLKKLVGHSNKCYGYTKYDSAGKVIGESNMVNPCSWKSRTSAAASPSDAEIYVSEMKNMENNNSTRINDANNTIYKNKKRKLDHMNMVYTREENEIYKPSKGKITTYCSKPLPPLSNDESKRADAAFCQLFTVCAVPYNVMNHPLYKRAVRTLRPDYKPVSGQVSSGRVLDEISNENDDLKEKIHNQKSSILADGSNNGARQSVIHVYAIGSFGVRLIDAIYHNDGIMYCC